MLADMGNALDLVCQANAALAASIRQTAGWLGHASAQSASPAKLQQVCQPFLALACHFELQKHCPCVWHATKTPFHGCFSMANLAHASLLDFLNKVCTGLVFPVAFLRSDIATAWHASDDLAAERNACSSEDLCDLLPVLMKSGASLDFTLGSAVSFLGGTSAVVFCSYHAA